MCDCHLPASGDSPELKHCKENNLLVQNSDGSTYVGLCWPGRATWVDFFKSEAREWWAERTSQEKGYFWNDMNEPSSFGIWNKSLPKDCKSGEYTDKETHNAYATYQSSSTYKGMRMRDDKRPFSLTRAFFAGTQKYAWAWTGDNGSSPMHMMKSVSMIATANLCGMPFIGADVGGFSKTCDMDTLARWFNLACWVYPFFREHCIFSAARREPYLFASPHFDLMKNAIIERYKHIHFWYTASWRAHKYSTPIVRPTFIDFFESEEEHNRDYDVIVDGFILFSPTDQTSQTRLVKLPPGGWYNAKHEYVQGSIEIQNTINDVPVFFREGRIVPVISGQFKNTKEAISCPITLLAYADAQGNAKGDIYIDDYETNHHENGIFSHKLFEFENGKLKFHNAEDSPNQYSEGMPNHTIEKIIIFSRNQKIEKEISFTTNSDFEIIL